jgi:uncharacterized protein (TIGR02996 family)
MQEGDVYPPDAAPPVVLGRTWPPPRLTWTAQDAAFVADIRSSPDDDVPRLIYADWLTDQDDPRGLFIRLDIECLAEANPLHLRTLLRDRRRLLQRYESWWSPADKVVAIGGFTRGFLESVTMTAQQVIDHGEELFAREPIDELRMDLSWADHGIALAEAPALRSIRRLRLTYASVWRGILSFLDSPHLTALEALTVQRLWQRRSFADRDLSAVTHSRHFPQLRILRLQPFGPEQLQKLLAARWFAVERLEVPGWCEPAPSNPLDDEGPAVIHHESIGRVGLELLARHPAARSLRYLDASYNPVSLVLPEILASQHLANLATIRISDREELDLTQLRAKSVTAGR